MRVGVDEMKSPLSRRREGIPLCSVRGMAVAVAGRDRRTARPRIMAPFTGRPERSRGLRRFLSPGTLGRIETVGIKEEGGRGEVWREIKRFFL